MLTEKELRNQIKTSDVFYYKKSQKHYHEKNVVN